MINAFSTGDVQPRTYTNALDTKGLTPTVAAATDLGPGPSDASGGDASNSGPKQRLTIKRKLPIKLIVGTIVLLLFVIGGGAAYYLSQMNQDVRQQAFVAKDGYGNSAPKSKCEINPSDPSCQSNNTNVGCFVAGTQVAMADGSSKNIEDVKVGEWVKSYDEASATVVDKPVLALQSPINTHLVTLTFSDGTVTTNSDYHSYYVKNKGWSAYVINKAVQVYGFPVQQLSVGDVIVSYGGNNQLKETTLLNLQPLLQPTQTYNLATVQDTHTFFANGKVVHNSANKSQKQNKDVDTDAGNTNNICARNPKAPGCGETVARELVCGPNETKVGNSCIGSVTVGLLGGVGSDSFCKAYPNYESCASKQEAKVAFINAVCEGHWNEPICQGISRSGTACGGSGQPICMNQLNNGNEGCLAGTVAVGSRCVTSSENTSTPTTTKLTNAEVRRLSETCTRGFDTSAGTCLPDSYNDTNKDGKITYGELNLGGGSSCTSNAMCASGGCSSGGYCLSDTNPDKNAVTLVDPFTSQPAQARADSTGDANTRYVPTTDNIVLTTKDITLINNSTAGGDGAKCDSSYDCKIGYSCGQGTRTCLADSKFIDVMYGSGCKSNVSCPVGYMCSNNACVVDPLKPDVFTPPNLGRSNPPSDKNLTNAFGLCKGVVCTNAAGGCIAIHMLPEKWPDGQVTVTYPIVTTGSVDAQKIANENCMHVQVDVLNGGNGSCVNGHINGDWSTLVGAVVVSPTTCTPAPTQVAKTTQTNITSTDGYTPPTGGTPTGGGATPTPTPTVRPSTSPTATPSGTPVATVTPTPTPTTTTAATPTPTPTITQTAALVGCGDACAQTSDCSNLNHICYQGTCRLASNPTSTSCVLPAAGSATQPQAGQPSLPQELPTSGSDTLGSIMKVGLGVLGFGALLLLFL